MSTDITRRNGNTPVVGKTAIGRDPADSGGLGDSRRCDAPAPALRWNLYNILSAALFTGALSACSMHGAQPEQVVGETAGLFPAPATPGEIGNVVDQGRAEVAAVNTAAESASSVETVQVSVDNLRLSDAVGLAIARHPDISRAQAIVAQSESEVAIAKSAWYPTFEYGVNPKYSRSLHQETYASVGVSQLVYDFGRTRSRIAAANATLEQERYELADTTESIAYSTATTFVDLAASQELIAAADRQVESLRTINKKIETRLKAGLSDASDLNEAEVAIQRAAAEALSARTEFDVAAGKLAEMAGVRPRRVQNLNATSVYIKKLGGDMRNAIEQTPSVLAAQAAVDAATANVKLAKADRFPSIGVTAGQGISTVRDYKGDYDRDTWIGLTLTGDISAGGLNRNRIKAAQAEQRAESQALENQRLVTRTALGSAETEAVGAEARSQSYGDVIGLSRALIDLYWQQYTLDKRSLTDVINAERDVYQSEVARINAVADGNRARIRANAAVGRFVVRLKETTSLQ